MDKQQYNECADEHLDEKCFMGNAPLYSLNNADKDVLLGYSDGTIIKVSLAKGVIKSVKVKPGCDPEDLVIKENVDIIKNLESIDYQKSDYDFIKYLHKHVPLKYWKKITLITYSQNVKQLN